MVTFPVNTQHLSMALSAVTEWQMWVVLGLGLFSHLCVNSALAGVLEQGWQADSATRMVLPRKPGRWILRDKWHQSRMTWKVTCLRLLFYDWLLISCSSFPFRSAPCPTYCSHPHTCSSSPPRETACSFLYCLFLLSTGVYFPAKSLELGVPPSS